jgi:hypothetical protein
LKFLHPYTVVRTYEIKTLTERMLLEKEKIMVFKFQRQHIGVSIFGFLIAGLYVFSCTNTPTNLEPVANITLADLHVTTQVTGWTAVGNPVNFVDSTITNLVDGGSSTYCGVCSHSTLKAGFQQIMSKYQSVDHIKLFVIDYGTASNATAEFDKMVQGSSWTTENALSPYSVSELFYTSNSDGINLRSHFKNFYVEFQFTAYDSSAQAVPDASNFINYLHSKIVQ